MRATTLDYVGQLTTTVCWCGIHYAVPSDLLDRAQNHGHTIYCPNGHVCEWRETEADRLRKQLAREQQRRQAEMDLRLDTERRLAAQKGATTKARKRHAAALCPCCNRSFVQLRRHMEAKHPDYDPAKEGCDPAKLDAAGGVITRLAEAAAARDVEVPDA